MANARFVDRLISWRYALLAIAATIAFTSWLCVPAPTFDRSIENMFPAESSVLADYQQLKRTFGGNEIVLAVYEDVALFAKSGEGIRRVRRVSERLHAVSGIKAVLSIDQPLPKDWIVRDTALAKRTRNLFSGYTHGPDGCTVSIVCMLYPVDQTDVPRRETIDQMREIMHSLPDNLAPGHLTGEPIMVVDGFRFVEQDGERLGTWSTLLLGSTIILCFRSVRWVVIPVIVVQLSLVMTHTFLAVARIRLSMVSSMLTAVVMVIGVATMVHVMVRYTESRQLGLSPQDSLQRTFSQLWYPVSWACLTDAAGFLALTVSEVGPVFDFGVMMAIGSLMVWLSVLLLVPGLTLVGHIDLDPQTPWGEGRMVRQLQNTLKLICRRPYRLLLGLVSVALLTITGVGQLRVETDFTRNFRADSDIATAYRFAEQRLGGAGVCDVVVPAESELTWPYLEGLYELGQQLRELPIREGQFSPITKSFSLADALVALSPVDIRSQPRWIQKGAISGLKTLRGWMPEFYDALYGQDPVNGQYYSRLMLRVKERQSVRQKRELLQQVTAVTQSTYPKAKVTGYFVLLSEMIDSVLRDQWRTFVVAVAGIGLLMTVAFRDLRLALIALVPNAFPILVVLGAMGWLSAWVWPTLKINMGTAMIAAVSMGLSIDSSIHYIIGFQRAIRQGSSVGDALARVQARVGKAMVLSTLALSVGFAVLATSDFIPTVYFGVLVTLAMLGGLAGNLVSLPLLIWLFYGTKCRGKNGTGQKFG